MIRLFEVEVPVTKCSPVHRKVAAREAIVGLNAIDVATRSLAYQSITIPVSHSDVAAVGQEAAKDQGADLS